MDMRVKAPKNPNEEIISHDLDTTVMTCLTSGNNDWIITGGSEGCVVKRSGENTDQLETFKSQNYKNNGVNCLYASKNYPLIYTGGEDGSIVIIKTGNFKYRNDFKEKPE